MCDVKEPCPNCGEVHSNLHVLWSRMDRVYRRVIFCPTCQCRRRFFVWAQDWYDPVATCCTCGDAWEGDERMQRPFKRGWREESARRARRLWAESLERTA